MLRYSLVLHMEEPLYLAACYDYTGSGICTTKSVEDACSWVMYETASKVARHVTEILKVDVSIRQAAI